MVDWNEHIVIDPAILVGKPVVKGTRLAVEFIIGLLAQGWTESEILRNYPGLTHTYVLACQGNPDKVRFEPVIIDASNTL
jgi:uncharacterized protein (DUF433 family)